MTRDLLIRGFDDKVHSQLGELANEKGVSINSIVKDAVDKWLQQQSHIPKKHYLVLYSKDEDMLKLLKAMDRFAKESNLFRCFCGPILDSELYGQYNTSQKKITTNSISANNFSLMLSKLNWYNATDINYYYKEIKTTKDHIQFQNLKNTMKYCNKVMGNIIKHSNGKQVCCMDFLINDIAKSSLQQALRIEKTYDNNRIPGLMYCTYKINRLLNGQINDLVELFEGHDQVFILKEDEIYKLYITKENLHKLFLI
ncbi:MAG: hypothetical protein ACPKPY_06970 [Nitrososphaeraceae archaeon]